jgi:D-glycero-beta-D-manno-heptose-7-phosphate kinase
MPCEPVLVIGDSTLERYWEGGVERISAEAPVPVLRFDREQQRAGGAANVALNLAALGARVTLLTVMGRDEAADRLRDLLADGGVRLRAVCVEPATAQKIRAVCRRQQLLRIDIEQAPTQASARELCALAQTFMASHRWVVLCDHGKGALRLGAQLVDAARAHGGRTLVDPQGREVERYRGAWLLKPNESQARALTGGWSDERGFVEAMEVLRGRLALRYLLVTRGERGASLFGAGQAPQHVDTEAREVFDASGAGDTTLATLAAFLAAGHPIDQALRQANRAAGIAVERFGTAVVSMNDLHRDRGRLRL